MKEARVKKEKELLLFVITNYLLFWLDQPHRTQCMVTALHLHQALKKEKVGILFLDKQSLLSFQLIFSEKKQQPAFWF